MVESVCPRGCVGPCPHRAPVQLRIEGPFFSGSMLTIAANAAGLHRRWYEVPIFLDFLLRRRINKLINAKILDDSKEPPGPVMFDVKLK